MTVSAHVSNHSFSRPIETTGAEEMIDDLLRGSSTSDALTTLETARPWGRYRRVDVGHRYQVKRITVEPGGTLSLQKHHHRAEHWVVVAGRAEVTIDGVVSLISEGESVFIPKGAVHRCTNPGKIPVVFIEIQTGAYTGEDDIVRIEDVYGRV